MLATTHTPRRTRFRPPLRKRYVATQEGYDVYTVDAYAVRNATEPDEEFTNFATHEQFPDLIPPEEIWISDKIFEEEGTFFLTDALVRLKEQEAGKSGGSAYYAGQKVERRLRERLLGIAFRAGQPHRRVPSRVYVEPYLTLADPKYPVQVWRVDGCLVRSFYKTDYTEGGHCVVYRWVPKGEIWIERAVERVEVPFILCHEYLELRLMRDEGMDYDRAHGIAARLEFDLRKGKGLQSLLIPGRRRRLVKKDVHRLTEDAVLKQVLKSYAGK